MSNVSSVNVVTGSEAMPQILLSRKEVCEVLRCKTSWAIKAVKTGKLPKPIEIAGRKLFFKDDIIAYLLKAREEANGGTASN